MVIHIWGNTNFVLQKSSLRNFRALVLKSGGIKMARTLSIIILEYISFAAYEL